MVFPVRASIKARLEPVPGMTGLLDGARKHAPGHDRRPIGQVAGHALEAPG